MDPLSRREFAELASLAIVGALLPPRDRAVLTLEEATVKELQDGMKAGRLTSRRITQAYLDRIAALDRKGPALRAVLEINPDARTIADAMDAERREEDPIGATLLAEVRALREEIAQLRAQKSEL